MFDTKDFINFPVWFSYMNFYLGTLTSGNAYTLALKEITLCYKDVEISGVNLPEMPGLQVYPNPADNGEIKVKLLNNIAENLTLELFNSSGQSVLNKKFSGNHQNEISFGIDHLSRGTYLLKVTQDEKKDVVKLLIK